MKYTHDIWNDDEISEKLDDIEHGYDIKIESLEEAKDPKEYECTREKQAFMKAFGDFETLMAVNYLSVALLEHIFSMFKGLKTLVSDDKLMYNEIQKALECFNMYRNDYNKALMGRIERFVKPFNISHSQEYKYGKKLSTFSYFSSLFSKWKKVKFNAKKAYDVLDWDDSEYVFESTTYPYENERRYGEVYTKDANEYLERFNNLPHFFSDKYEKIKKDIKRNIIIYDKLLYVVEDAISIMENTFNEYLKILDSGWVLTEQKEKIFDVLNGVKLKIRDRLTQYERKIEEDMSYLEEITEKRNEEAEVFEELNEKIEEIKALLEDGDINSASEAIKEAEFLVPKISKESQSKKKKELKELRKRVERSKITADARQKKQETKESGDDEATMEYEEKESFDEIDKKDEEQQTKIVPKKGLRAFFKDSGKKANVSASSDLAAEIESIKQEFMATVAYLYADFILEKYRPGLTIDDLDLRELQKLVKACDCYAEASDMDETEKALYFGTYVEKIYKRDCISTNLNGGVKKVDELTKTEKKVYEAQLRYIQLSPEIFELDEEYKRKSTPYKID